MSNPERGAASVNVMAFIFALVVIIGLGATVWTYATEREDFVEARDKAERERQVAIDTNTATIGQLIEITNAVGFANPDDPNSSSQPEAIKARLENLKNNYDHVGAGVTNLEELITALQDRVTQVESSTTPTTTSAPRRTRSATAAPTPSPPLAPSTRPPSPTGRRATTSRPASSSSASTATRPATRSSRASSPTPRRGSAPPRRRPTSASRP